MPANEAAVKEFYSIINELQKMEAKRKEILRLVIDTIDLCETIIEREEEEYNKNQF